MVRWPGMICKPSGSQFTRVDHKSLLQILGGGVRSEVLQQGTDWAGGVVAGPESSGGPCLAASPPLLDMAWKGEADDQGIYWSRSDTEDGWTPQIRVRGVGTSFGPALANFRNQLYMAWKGVDDDQGIYWSFFDGANWMPQSRPRRRRQQPLALV